MSHPGRRLAWIDCSAGVAGDMLLGALLDAGADRRAVTAAATALGLDDLGGVTVAEVVRGGITATHVRVEVADAPHPHRPARDVHAAIAGASLDPAVRDDALAVYGALAAVEGRVHGRDPGDVELHEVGALDSIVDVVCVCAALADLGVDRLVHGPIGASHGTVRTAHGPMSTPVPAVVELAAAHGLTLVGVDAPFETATPTGVALLATLGEPVATMPAMTVGAVGVGAGTADAPGRPNVVRVVLGDATDVPGVDGRPTERLHEVATNVDDVTGEVLARTIDRALLAGAVDAWVTPIVMKKGRPAHTVHALCRAVDLDRVVAVVRDETGSLGVRATPVDRWAAERREVVVEVHGHAVRVKLAPHRAKVEHDDALAAAEALGITLREVLRLAETLATDEPHAT